MLYGGQGLERRARYGKAAVLLWLQSDKSRNDLPACQPADGRCHAAVGASRLWGRSGSTFFSSSSGWYALFRLFLLLFDSIPGD